MSTPLIQEISELLVNSADPLLECECAVDEVREFCDEVGIELKSKDPDRLVIEIDDWLESGDLSVEEHQQLTEFAARLQRAVSRVAHTVGKAVGAAHRVANKYHAARSNAKKFVSKVKRSYHAGVQGNTSVKRPKRPMKRPTKAPINRPKKRPAGPARRVK